MGARAPFATADAVTEQQHPAMGTSRVYYKFFAALDYEAVTFNGLHISLRELKCKIRARKKLKATKCDLLVTNAQTKEGTRGRWARGGKQ